MTLRSARPSYVDEAEGRVTALRAELGIGSDALGDVFELLGHLGLDVVGWPMGENGLDGFYLRQGDLAVVAVNSAEHVGCQRFTACHELDHHLFDSQSCIDPNAFASNTVPERRANAFAARFLMPGEGVRRWLQREPTTRGGGPITPPRRWYTCRVTSA